MIYFNIRECFWNAYMVLRKCWHTVGLEWHKGNWPKFLNFIQLVLNCSASTRLCKNTFVCLKCIIQYLVVYYFLCINFGMCTNREEEWEQSSGHLKSMWTRRGCLLESIEYNQPASFNPIPSSLSQYALILTTHGVHSSSTSCPEGLSKAADLSRGIVGDGRKVWVIEIYYQLLYQQKILSDFGNKFPTQ